MRLAPKTCVVAACLVACVSCGREQSAAPGPASAGDAQRLNSTATDFSARDVEGGTVRLSTYLGRQAVLLNFCATWCEPCVAEFPHLRKLYEANRAKGFLILGIAMDGPDTVANVPAFVKRNQINFPMLLDEDSHVAAIYNPKKSAPLSVLIDKHGRIAAIRDGYNPGDEEYLAKEVAKVLDGPPAAQ